MQAAKPESKETPKYILIHLGKLYLNVSFACKLSAMVETDIHKKTSSSVQFDTATGEANFSQQLRLRVKSAEKLPLNLTVVIIKGSSKKKVGVIRFDLNYEEGDRVLRRYAVQECPQKNVFLEVGYEWEAENFAAKRFSGKLKSKTEQKNLEKQKEHVFKSQKSQKLIPRFQRGQMMPPKRLFHTHDSRNPIRLPKFSQRTRNGLSSKYKADRTPMKNPNLGNFGKNLTPLTLKMSNRRMSGIVKLNGTPRSSKRSQLSARSHVKNVDAPPVMISTPVKGFKKKFPLGRSNQANQTDRDKMLGVKGQSKKSMTGKKNHDIFDEIFSKSKKPVENIYENKKVESFKVKGDSRRSQKAPNPFVSNNKDSTQTGQKELFDSDDIFSAPKKSNKTVNLSGSDKVGSSKILETKQKKNAPKSIWNVAVHSENQNNLDQKKCFTNRNGDLSNLSSTKNESLYSSDIRSRGVSDNATRLKESVFETRRSTGNGSLYDRNQQTSNGQLATSKENLPASSIHQQKSLKNLKKGSLKGSMRISIGPKMGASLADSMGEGFFRIESSKTENLKKLDKLQSQSKDLRERMKNKMRSRREASREQKIMRYTNSRSRSPGQSIKLKFGKSSRALSKKSKGSLWANGKDKNVNIYQRKDFKVGGPNVGCLPASNRKNKEQMSLKVRRNDDEGSINKNSGLGSEIDSSNLNSQKQSDNCSQKTQPKLRKKTKTTIFGDFLDRKPKLGNMSLQVEPAESRRMSLGKKKKKVISRKRDDRERQNTPDTGLDISGGRNQIFKSNTIHPPASKLKAPTHPNSSKSKEEKSEKLHFYTSQSNSQAQSIHNNFLSNEQTDLEFQNLNKEAKPEQPKRKSLVKSETHHGSFKAGKRKNLAVVEMEERFKTEKRKWELQKMEMEEIIAHLKSDSKRKDQKEEGKEPQIAVLTRKIEELESERIRIEARLTQQKKDFEMESNAMHARISKKEKEIVTLKFEIEETQTEKELLKEFLQKEREERKQERAEAQKKPREFSPTSEGVTKLNRKIKVLEEQNRRLMDERRQWKVETGSIKQEGKSETKKLNERIRRLQVQNQDFEGKVKEFMCKEVELKADFRSKEEKFEKEMEGQRQIVRKLREEIEDLQEQIRVAKEVKLDFEIWGFKTMGYLKPKSEKFGEIEKIDVSENLIFVNLENEIRKLKEEKLDSTKCVEKMQNQIENLETEKTKLQQKAKAKDLEIQNLVSQKGELEQKISRLGSQTLQKGELETELRSEIERVRKERDKKETELQQQIEEREETIRLKEEETKAQTLIVKEKETEIRENESYIQIIEKKLKKKETEIDLELNSKLTALNQKNAELLSQNEKLKLEKEENQQKSESQILILEKEKSDLESEISSSKKKISDLESQISTQDEILKQLKTEKINSKAKISELQVELQTATENRESAEFSEYEKEKMRKTSKALEIKVATLKGDLRSAEKSRQLAVKEKTELAKQVGQLEGKLKKAEEVRRLLEKGFTKSKSKIGNVLSQLNSMKLKSKVRDQLIELLVDYN